MGATGIFEYSAPSPLTVDPEREECEWLLTSGVLGRSGNLARVLRYICEEHFQGRAEQIKEYTVATEALGRRADFDPQSDTIVRVTVHALRKRLQDVYQNEGAQRPIRLAIPPGHYAPSFIPHHPSDERARGEQEHAEITEDGVVAAAPADAVADGERERRRWIWVAAALAFAAVAGAGWWIWHQRAKMVSRDLALTSATLPAPAAQDTVRALMGSGRKPYVDQSGNRWSEDNYCQSGTSHTVPPQKIEGTEDPALYLTGVRGIAHCTFPVTQGLYEVHFYFAETTDLPPATKAATISVNDGQGRRVDVVNDAGGDHTATSMVMTGVAPENDGAIHVDFVSDISLLNAVEMLPAPSAQLLPVRIVAKPASFTDEAGQVWSSDRYFSGGRRGLPPKSAIKAGLGLYQSDRIGRFRYTIPAVPWAHYRLRLYFREPWFGTENGGNGGPGSRVFSVACNGVMLLKDLDILAEGGSRPIVKTFDNVQAGADGRVEISFLPGVNYPVVNAIELIPKD